VIATSALIRDDGLLALAGAASLALAARAGLARPRVRYRVHQAWLRVPLLSRLVRSVNAARFAQTLATLVSSGVALVDALPVAAQVVSSLPMQRAVRDAAQRVAEGESLSGALAGSALFPPVMVELVASGEGSGRLDAMLERAALSQEQDARLLVRTALGLLEPLLTLAMGAVVLTIVLSMLLPLFELNRLLG
jgi:general secretion pathway protein F